MAHPLAQPMTLTDAQYRALAIAASDGDNVVHATRVGGLATESTVRSLAARGIGTLQHDMAGSRKVVTGVYVTVAGWLVFSRETDRRRAAADTERNARQPEPIRAEPRRSATVDPFAMFARTARARRERAIDQAFAL